MAFFKNSLYSVVDDEKYIKFNEDKAMQWLSAKVHRLVEVIKRCNVNVSTSGAKAAGYTTGKEDTQSKGIRMLIYRVIIHRFQE